MPSDAAQMVAKFQIADESIYPPALAQSLPCRICHTGPAPVSSYFITESGPVPSGEGTYCAATFRGRLIWAHDAVLPDGYRFYAAKKTRKNGDEQIFHLDSAEGQPLRIWDFDGEASVKNDSSLQRSINFLKVAIALAESDDESEETIA